MHLLNSNSCALLNCVFAYGFLVKSAIIYSLNYNSIYHSLELNKMAYVINTIDDWGIPTFDIITWEK